jgi:hypothetical protein
MAVEVGLVGLEDLAHTSPTDRAEDLVLPHGFRDGAHDRPIIAAAPRGVADVSPRSDAAVDQAKAGPRPRVSSGRNNAKADYRARWLVFLFTLLFLAVVYWNIRDIVYHNLIYKYAQNLYNGLGSAAVEKIGSVTVNGQGDVTLHDAEAYTHRNGARRLFFKTERLVLSLDGMPLRDDRLRVMRVDLFRPEIHVRRETGGEWNVEWAFLPAPRGPEEKPPDVSPDDPWKDYLQPDQTFPRNGVHVHDGTIHVTSSARPAIK